LTNDELIKALKYVSRKKTATRQKISKHLNPKEDITNDQLFYSYVDTVSAQQYVKGHYVPRQDDTFKLSTKGHNLLAEHIKESEAIGRANLSLLISFVAVLIAAATLIYGIFFR
jgi:lysophospholipase L1-like esterase